MKKLISYFGGIVPFFAAEAIEYTAVTLIALLYGVAAAFQAVLKSGITDKTELESAFNEILSQKTLYLISVIGVLVCGIVFFFWYRHQIRGEVRGSLRKLFTVKNILLFIILGIGCQLFMSGLMSLIQPLFNKIFMNYSNTVNELMSGSEIVVLVFMVLIAPVTEELIFRGVILHKTSRVIPFLGANLLQALLFGIYHWNIVQGVYATTIGFLLGFVYYKFRTIFASIFLHMIINASAFLAMLIPNSILSYVIVTVAGGGFVIISLLIMKPSDLMLSIKQNDNVTINHS